jgi:hypothetical protein
LTGLGGRTEFHADPAEAMAAGTTFEPTIHPPVMAGTHASRAILHDQILEDLIRFGQELANFPAMMPVQRKPAKNHA